MILLTLLLLSLIGVFIIITLIGWTVHLEMTKEDVSEYGYGNYSDFKKEFNKKEWTRNKMYPKSFFNDIGFLDNHIHARIIKFDNKGMCLTYFAYLRFIYFEEKNKISGKNTVKW